jgi:hypothetical protein
VITHGRAHRDQANLQFLHHHGVALLADFG